MYDTAYNLPVYNVPRWYEPAVGRYTRPDPLGLGEEVNNYLYVRGNPLLLGDLMGLFWTTDFVKRYFRGDGSPLNFKLPLLIFLTSTASLWVGCNPDYTIELSGHYRLMRITGADTFVLYWPEDHPRGLIAGPSVVGYRDSEHLVLGLVEQPHGLLEGERLGYFLVDKRERQTYWSLSRQEWLKKLQEYGIEEEPRLIRPNRFQAWF